MIVVIRVRLDRGPEVFRRFKALSARHKEWNEHLIRKWPCMNIMYASSENHMFMQGMISYERK